LLINNSIISAQGSEVRHFGNLPRVLMDKGKMEQVFINLFMNALQAMPPGGVLTVTTRAGRLGRDFELSARNFPQFQRGDRLVMVEVLDSGPGIPEAYMPKLFEPFFTTKPAGVGTGLGLPVVKKIMELHSGAIDIHNAPHGGVLVTLILRAVKEDYDDT
jgi:signal transduction histidine kinase